ncbi:TrsE [Bacillus sonorensis]|uniref:VirB4 family type IV secretion system protein n=1 Tax=Bacillus sonorensis TaxID=119858 RepID=UPI002DB6D60D|nr:TrsE [Bacillus sonorensis]MEC0526219.1 TrsE [Bacillus sonorensis]
MKLPLPFLKKKKAGFTTEESYTRLNTNIVNRIAPDSITETEDNIISGGNYTQTLVIVDYTSVLSQENIQRLTDLNENISIVQYISYFEPSKVVKQLNVAIEQNEIKESSRYSKGVTRKRAEAENAAAEMLLNNTIFKGKRMFLFQLLVHCVAQSQEELNRVVNRVKSEIGSFGKAIYPRKKAKDAFDSILPLNNNKVYELTYRPMSSTAVSYAFPFHENEIYHSGGKIKGRNILTSNIVKVDEEALLNKHSAYVGISGSGKSTAMFTDMARDFMFGNRIYTLDPKKDYGEKYKAMGGEWIKFGLEEDGKRINIFDVPARAVVAEDDDSDKVNESNPLLDKITTLTVFFKLMYPQLDALQEATLNQALMQVYKDKGIHQNTDFSKVKKEEFPILQDLYDLIESWKKNDADRYMVLKEFHQILYSYCKEGLYNNLFNGYTNVKLDNDLIDFDISAVYRIDQVKKLIYFLLLSYLRYEILNGDGKPTKLYIDEAHIIADPNVVVAMEYLFELMKVVRSFNCGVAVATQSISDFLSAKTEFRNYGEAVLDQAIQMLILPMKRKEVEFVNETLQLGLDEKDKDFLTLYEATKKEQAGKGFYYLGSKKVKMEVFLTELEEELWFKKNYSIFEDAL